MNKIIVTVDDTCISSKRIFITVQKIFQTRRILIVQNNADTAKYLRHFVNMINTRMIKIFSTDYIFLLFFRINIAF